MSERGQKWGGKKFGESLPERFTGSTRNTQYFQTGKDFIKNNCHFLFTIAALIGEKRGFETGEVVKRVVMRLLVDRLTSS